jgi:RHS repeat-associated protein
MNQLLPTCFLILVIAIGLEGSPYAPESVSGSPQGDLSYTYNTMGQRVDNGLVDSDQQHIDWGLMGKPVKITTGTNSGGSDSSVEFAYGPGGQRYLRKNPDGIKTYYVGDMEYRVAQDDAGIKSSKSVVYIRNGGYSPLAMVETSGDTPGYSYFLRDHLGSNLMSVDDSANLVDGKSHGRHDPWGQPWDADGTGNELKKDSRGFTGHENIASVGLIHMNGRVYDPMVGQFLGPDRLLQNANRTVGLNRYAYVGNSPINGTDPSGWAYRVSGSAVGIRNTENLLTQLHHENSHRYYNHFDNSNLTFEINSRNSRRPPGLTISPQGNQITRTRLNVPENLDLTTLKSYIAAGGILAENDMVRQNFLNVTNHAVIPFSRANDIVLMKFQMDAYASLRRDIGHPLMNRRGLYAESMQRALTMDPHVADHNMIRMESGTLPILHFEVYSDFLRLPAYNDLVFAEARFDLAHGFPPFQGISPDRFTPDDLAVFNRSVDSALSRSFSAAAAEEGYLNEAERTHLSR